MPPPVTTLSPRFTPRQHLALRLDLGLLRTDQQEVEDDENQDQREELDEEIRSRRTGALRPSFLMNISSDLHATPDPRPAWSKSGRTIAALHRFATQVRGDMVAPFSASMASDDDGSRP